MRTKNVVITVLAGLVCSMAAVAQAEEFRRLPVSEYVSKMKAGWIGQMVGVGWGAPTEFRWRSEIIPADKVPEWKPDMVNQYNQDDIYVEMTFMRSLELYGPEVSIRQAGIDFANSGYMLWHANKAGRDLLREGIAPPDSGHPKFNTHADDIDYQIEADFSGLISPGLPNEVIRLGEIFGRLMNYGDGLYGGQFVGGMYAEAFFEKDIGKLVEAGLACVPKKSRFAECIRDVIKWHKQNPKDWKKTWQLVEDKYNTNPDNRLFSCGEDRVFNIDAKINAAYIVMGMLYGEGDIEDTNVISMRCGQDSDCNPSNAAGVLFTSMGLEALPAEYTSALVLDTKFSHTPYDFAKLIDVSVDLVRNQVIRAGGRVEKNAAGEDVFVIPVRKVKTSKLEQCWTPGPAANSKFSDAEMGQIDPPPEPEWESAEQVDISKDVAKFAPGWFIKGCANDMDPGLHEELGGRKNVLVTHPVTEKMPSSLYKKVDVPKGKKTTLHLVVGHFPEGDWQLLVNIEDNNLLDTSVGEDTAKDGWLEVDVDLSAYAGDSVWLELRNQASGWAYEAARWAEITIKSK